MADLGILTYLENRWSLINLAKNGPRGLIFTPDYLQFHYNLRQLLYFATVRQKEPILSNLINA